MAVVDIRNTSYHVDNKLMGHWEKNSLKMMIKRNADRVYIVDGKERIGKSTWVFQQMGVIEPELFNNVEKFLSRVCIDVDEFNMTCRTTKNGVVVFDEGFRGFSSRSALSKTNKMLIQTLMEMGQNNNIVFIVLPSFFLLDIYPAMIRSNSLFHIRPDKRSGMRVWEGFNAGDKNEIFRQGVKKSWKYKATFFRGRFPKQFPGGEVFEKAYNAKKSQAFIEVSMKMYEKKEEVTKQMLERDKTWLMMYNNPESYHSEKKSMR
ncbi:MAG: hypothetical protein IH845_05810, partial [Nanoarchaeota archaeon]|nr:hypothetical protein [Nanoarchaeota archaeon]